MKFYEHYKNYIRIFEKDACGNKILDYHDLAIKELYEEIIALKNRFEELESKNRERISTLCEDIIVLKQRVEELEKYEN